MDLLRIAVIVLLFNIHLRQESTNALVNVLLIHMTKNAKTVITDASTALIAH